MWSDADRYSPDLFDEVDEAVEGGTFIEVNGARIDVNPGENFFAKVLSVAQEAGYGKFRVWLNGSEINDPSDAPDIFSEGDQVRVTAFDEAGLA